MNKKVELVMFMGQSNMAGRGESERAVVCPEGQGYEFRSVTAPDTLFPVTEPFGKAENNEAVNDYNDEGRERRSGGMVSSVMKAYYDAAQLPMVGVQCSRGGTSVEWWVSEAVLGEAERRFRSAKAYLEENGYEIAHSIMVWCQGETDGDRIFCGDETIEEYKERTRRLFDFMKGQGIEHIFMVQTGHFNGRAEDIEHEAAYIAVGDAQSEIAASDKDITVTASLRHHKAQMKDVFHYHQEAYNEVGEITGRAIAEYYR